MKQRILILIAIILLTNSFAPAQSANKEEATFKSLITQLTDAQTAFDAKTLDAIFAADYIEISPAGEFDPREKVLTFYQPADMPDASKMETKVEATEHSIRNYGKFAVVIVRLNYAIKVEGKPLSPRSIRATYLMRKEGKTWKIASAQYPAIRPPQAPKPQ